LGHDGFKLAAMFEVSQFGLQRTGENSLRSAHVEKQLGELFTALKAKHVISVDYTPVFKAETVITLTLSPQRIRYINSHLYLQAYDHETDELKNFDIGRIKNTLVTTKLKYLLKRTAMHG
jgi:predicted DNA-binding transcriptional regulator YafY